jgi:hypothetical protein
MNKIIISLVLIIVGVPLLNLSGALVIIKPYAIISGSIFLVSTLLGASGYFLKYLKGGK